MLREGRKEERAHSHTQPELRNPELLVRFCPSKLWEPEQVAPLWASLLSSERMLGKGSSRADLLPTSQSQRDDN